MLRIRDVYLEYRILTFINPGSRKKHIPDLGSGGQEDTGSRITLVVRLFYTSNGAVAEDGNELKPSEISELH